MIDELTNRLVGGTNGAPKARVLAYALVPARNGACWSPTPLHRTSGVRSVLSTPAVRKGPRLGMNVHTGTLLRYVPVHNAACV